jgi:hypothetical protein
MAAHHVYVEVVCPCCLQQRTTRKDLLAKAVKQQKQLFCKPCALKARPVTWKKSVEELVRNQGAYKSYCKAKRRVKTNHKNAYAHVEFQSVQKYKVLLKFLDMAISPHRKSALKLLPTYIQRVFFFFYLLSPTLFDPERYFQQIPQNHLVLFVNVQNHFLQKQNLLSQLQLFDFY